MAVKHLTDIKSTFLWHPKSIVNISVRIAELPSHLSMVANTAWAHDYATFLFMNSLYGFFAEVFSFLFSLEALDLCLEKSLRLFSLESESESSK